MTLINRFRTKALRNRDVFDTMYPVLRMSAHGAQYWTILEEENSRFLEELGYYDDSFYTESKNIMNNGNKIGKKAWTAVRAVDLTKILRMTNEAAEVGSKAQCEERSNFPVVSDKTDFAEMSALHTASPRFTSHASGVPLRFLSQAGTCKMSVPANQRVDMDINASSFSPCVLSAELNNNDVPADHSGFNMCHLRDLCDATSNIKSLLLEDSHILGKQAWSPSAAHPMLDPKDVDQQIQVHALQDGATTISSQTLTEIDAASMSGRSQRHVLPQASDQLHIHTSGSKNICSLSDCQEEAEVCEVIRVVLMFLSVVVIMQKYS